MTIIFLMRLLHHSVSFELPKHSSHRCPVKDAIHLKMLWFRGSGQAPIMAYALGSAITKSQGADRVNSASLLLTVSPLPSLFGAYP